MDILFNEYNSMNKLHVFIVILGTLILSIGIVVIFNQMKGSIKPAPSAQQANNPASKIAPYLNITVSDTGFSPTQVSVDKEMLIHFVNTTDKIIQIIPIKNKIEIAPIPPGKTGISLPLFESGEYEFTVDNESGFIGKIIVRQ